MSGFFSIGVYHPKYEVNIGTLWRSAYSFGAQYIFTVGGRKYKPQSSDTVKAWHSIPLFHFEDVEDLLKGLPRDCPLIGVELKNHAESLDYYKHPPRGCYLLGAEDNGLPTAVLQKCHHCIVIPHAKQCLNVSVAGSIVMYDRESKKGKETNAKNNPALQWG